MSISEHKHMPEPVRRIELFTGAGRRRSWSAAEKAAIVAESYGGGETVCGVARRHGLTPQQLFTWRRLARPPALAAPPVFVPAIVETAEPEAPVPLKARRRVRRRLELGRAALVVRPRWHNQADQDAAFRVYANELTAFPVDVVVTAIRAGDHGWFPPLDIVKGRCVEAIRSRQRILKALQRETEAPKAETESAPRTQDDKAYVTRIVAELTAKLRVTEAEMKSSTVLPSAPARQYREPSREECLADLEKLRQAGYAPPAIEGDSQGPDARAALKERCFRGGGRPGDAVSMVRRGRRSECRGANFEARFQAEQTVHSRSH